MGLALNETARAVDNARAKEQLDALFAPGGIWYVASPVLTDEDSK